MSMFLDYVLPNMIDFLEMACNILTMVAVVLFIFIGIKHFKDKTI